MAHPIRRGGSDRARRALTLPLTPPENFDACQIPYVGSYFLRISVENTSLMPLLGQPY